MNKETGGSAFPIAQINATVTTDGMGRVHQTAFVPAREGMTLRDYFAGQALLNIACEGSTMAIAGYCYKLADAMLKEREK